jgi:hypothetical protein
MKSILDRFGAKERTEILDEDHFTAAIEVCVSPLFSVGL